MNRFRRGIFVSVSILLPSSLILCLSGCAVLGLIAHAAPPATVKPQYTNLAGESIGVMVWADRGVLNDWGTVQLDLANAIQKQLEHENAKKIKTLEGATFPVQPASIVRYQRDNPQVAMQPITQVAPVLGVSRLIYVELEDFATRSDMSVELFRGQAKATVRVLEVPAGGGEAKIAFEKNDVVTVFPPKVPREGIPNAGDRRIYAGLIDAFGTDIAHLFVPWRPEEHQ